MQHSTEIMHIIGLVLSTRVQLFGKGEERPGIFVEEIYVKDGLWVGDLVLL